MTKAKLYQTMRQTAIGGAIALSALAANTQAGVEPVKVDPKAEACALSGLGTMNMGVVKIRDFKGENGASGQRSFEVAQTEPGKPEQVARISFSNTDTFITTASKGRDCISFSNFLPGHSFDAMQAVHASHNIVVLTMLAARQRVCWQNR